MSVSEAMTYSLGCCESMVLLVWASNYTGIAGLAGGSRRCYKAWESPTFPSFSHGNAGAGTKCHTGGALLPCLVPAASSVADVRSENI
jgi:hypothetical protein